jgi:hypothetical protein
MNSTKLQIESQLKLLSSQSGLDIDTPCQWVVENLNDPLLFFENLAIFVGRDAVLYIECLDIVPEASAFYFGQQSPHREIVARDLVFPIPIIYHLRFSPELVVGMKRLASKFSIDSLFSHIKCYKDKQIVFTFHDAFNGYLRIADNVSEVNVGKFCNALKCGYALEKTVPRDLQQLQKILSSLQGQQ